LVLAYYSTVADIGQLASMQVVPGLTPESVGGFRPTKDALGLDPAEFSKKYANPVFGGCMSLPMSLWRSD
jgi:hypothetical protein